MQTKLTIAIPCYNNEKTIREAIESALAQEYPNKEILVIDDCSKDDTVTKAMQYPVKVVVNTKNLGIGGNLTRCFEEAKGKYILFLCGDDKFADTHVAGDVVRIFDTQSDIGIIDRNYYQFLDGHDGAVMVVREPNILLSSINPSGMAFRVREIKPASNRIFIEMPSIVAQYLGFTRWTKLEYDTVAVRLWPSGNTGCNPSYYKESPIVVLTEFYGQGFKYHLNLIQLKNRAPKLVWREIWLTLKLNKSNVSDWKFWLCAIIAVMVPSSILSRLSNFYRHRINRYRVSILKRGENE